MVVLLPDVMVVTTVPLWLVCLNEELPPPPLPAGLPGVPPCTVWL